MANKKQFEKCHTYSKYKKHALKRISHKKQEHAIIEYLWTKLNEVSGTFIFFALQQYVKRKDNGRYALLDAYLPQINVIIEVDEEHHFAQENRSRDKEREGQIKLIGGDLYRIKASNYLQKNGDEYIVLEDKMYKLVNSLKVEIEKCKKEGRFHELDIEKSNYLGAYYHRKNGLYADRYDAVENERTMTELFNGVKRLCTKNDIEHEFELRLISPGRLVSSDKCDLSHDPQVEKSFLQVVFVDFPKDILGQKILLFAGVFEYQHEEWKLINKRISFTNDSHADALVASY